MIESSRKDLADRINKNIEFSKMHLPFFNSVDFVFLFQPTFFYEFGTRFDATSVRYALNAGTIPASALSAIIPNGARIITG